MKKWDKVKNHYTGSEGMIIRIDDDLQLVEVRLEDTNEVKTLTMAQFERYWYTTYAIKKSGPKPKSKFVHDQKAIRNKYDTTDWHRQYDHHYKKIYKTRFPMEEIMNWIMELSEKYNMKFELINDRDYKFWVLYNGEYSKNSPIMVRKYKQQVNLYTKSQYLTDDIIRNSRMLYVKYYYDKCLRIVNFNDDTKAFVERVIKCVNDNYEPTIRPKTYKNHKRTKRSKKG